MPVDLITPQGGQLVAYGGVAERLLLNGMNVDALRTLAVLQIDEWKLIDTAVVTAARERLVAARDLIERGLTLNVPNALGITVVTHQTRSDMQPAEVSMDGVTRGNRDRLTFGTVNTPLPIIHQDFQLTARVLEASRRQGIPLDTSTAEEAARSVAERIEDMVVNGIPAGATFGFGSESATLQGYTNKTGRNTVSLANDWDASGVDGEDILDDVLAMISAAHVDLMFGPYILYVPSNYWVGLQDDFKANSDKTILQRLREVDGITDIKVSEKLADDNVVLVQMLKSNVDIVLGMEPTTLEWPSEGGMVLNYKVMAIMVPRIKHTKDGKSGIVHLS
jgi:uncharacterized linocin/CFP29 family protein